MKHVIKHIHFVGIGGSGMSGIAEVLLNLGYRISGSDLMLSQTTANLIRLGAAIKQGHTQENIIGADAIVISSAVTEDNPEVVAARQARIPVVPRAVMLAELMRLKQGIAIAGAHGKTTTTSLVTSVLAEAGLDPTFVIGGRLNSIGTHARLGTGDFIVVEADESDASFLNLHPVIEVITNIDTDHMSTYGHDLNKLKQAFIEFTQRLPFYGLVVACIDDEHIQSILPGLTKQVITYGFSDEAQFRAVDVRADHGRMHFTVLRKNGTPLPSLSITLNLPGDHNVLNALAAIAIATELEINDVAIISALAKFTGVNRRFQNYGKQALPNQGSYILIDDYGHHPTELAATLAATRAAFPKQRIVLAFQPHRYSRTRDCFEDFVRVLSTADVLLLTEVYAAGETPIVAADGRALARAIRVAGKLEPLFAETLEQMITTLSETLCDNDVLLVAGAGSISVLPTQLITWSDTSQSAAKPCSANMHIATTSSIAHLTCQTPPLKEEQTMPSTYSGGQR